MNFKEHHESIELLLKDKEYWNEKKQKNVLVILYILSALLLCHTIVAICNIIFNNVYNSTISHNFSVLEPKLQQRRPCNHIKHVDLSPCCRCG